MSGGVSDLARVNGQWSAQSDQIVHYIITNQVEIELLLYWLNEVGSFFGVDLFAKSLMLTKTWKMMVEPYLDGWTR